MKCKMCDNPMIDGFCVPCAVNRAGQTKSGVVNTVPIVSTTRYTVTYTRTVTSPDTDEPIVSVATIVFTTDGDVLVDGLIDYNGELGLLPRMQRLDTEFMDMWETSQSE